MDVETIYKFLTEEEDNEEFIILKQELVKYKLFDFNILYNADLLFDICTINSRFINDFNIYNSKLLQYINKDKCLVCDLKIIRGFGHCIKHINTINIKEIHQELLEIFKNLTDIQGDVSKNMGAVCGAAFQNTNISTLVNDGMKQMKAAMDKINGLCDVVIVNLHIK